MVVRRAAGTYPPLNMFKLMLPGQGYGLSDTQLEQALRLRPDFMVFAGLVPAVGQLPDSTTICRFRDRLVAARLDQKLLRVINNQLQESDDAQPLSLIKNSARNDDEFPTTNKCLLFL